MHSSGGIFLEQTWRWFGPYDTISLSEVRQTGATGIVTALHHVPIGEIWSVEEISKRKRKIGEAGLVWSVVESVPVHEDIKRRTGNYKKYVENYKQSIRNLGSCGIKTICYNFMPVLDWTRTDLKYKLPEGATTLRFDLIAFAAFELFTLKREEAQSEYSAEEISRAKEFYENLDDAGRESLEKTVLLGLPGSEEGYPLEEFRAILETYQGLSESDLRTHLYDFLKAIIPVAEESEVRMAIHPDDPPFSLLGLPRIVSTEDDALRLLRVANSEYNGLTFCAGSFGANPDNDLAGMVRRLGHRINFVHMRSVQREENRLSFHEAAHLEGNAGMADIMLGLLNEQERRVAEDRKDVVIPIRPDHGFAMLDDLRKSSFPGYSCIGRLKGLAELRGLETGMRYLLGRDS